MKIAIGLIVLCLMVGGCASINRYLGLPDDNKWEQAFEAWIEHYTGASVDLTPEK